MRIAIVQFEEVPEIILSVERAGMQAECVSPSESLDEYDGYIFLQKISSSPEVCRDKPVLGIGQGARFLVEAGLVPGVENNKAVIDWMDHSQEHPESMQLSNDYQLNAFTRHLDPKNILRISRAESYFVIPPALLIEMQLQGLTVFQYGSAENIAAVSNKAGNIMAMIPYFESASTWDLIFQSMHDYIRAGHVQSVAPLNYFKR